MRSLDTIITVVLTPIALLLLFVYVFGGALGEQTGSIEYVDFITPRDHHHDGDQRHRLYRAASQHGPPEGHHQPLPDHAGGALVGPERAGRVVDESNLFSCFLVVVVALLVGFRPAADTVAWLWLLRPAGALHPGHYLAGDVLRPAGKDARRRRCLQLHSAAAAAAADLHQPLVRPDGLHEAMATT
jgi:hypothetical protein